MSTKLKKRYKIHFSSLRDLINSWNLIPDSPLDEFDSVNHMCLGLLYRGADEFKLREAIHHELSVNYGFSIEKQESELLTKQVIKWWSDNK
ncbi:hypothetical protein [Allomuricauda sp. SCSIO 65647]|uniref:hypothetical protein n=1 Tax=Allomuricauda sp. SCSIO 65647 TaxID=2908843 RepID=UPI001F333270|nr:hypothetical protein [Muricauda sp. SCSIO 65647]UJH68386.1 hypothetical protein L0P89_04060 [Muricauda sp. SCSIO 65647]